MATSARLDELTKKFDENPRRYFAPLANEYRKLGDLTQAIALCRAHLPNQPGHISGHIVLAQALYEARELGESRQIFEASLELDPENLIALRFLGDIAREQGEPEYARGWYERVLEADPRNDEIALLLKELDLASDTIADGDALLDRPLPTPSEPQGVVSPTYATPTFMTAPVPARESLATPATDQLATPASAEASGAARDIQPSVVESRAATAAAGELVERSGEPVLDFPEPEEILHELPVGDALSFFEATTSDADYASTGEPTDDDPFFGAAASAGTAEEDRVDVVVSHSLEDDWFATRVAAGTPTPLETHALSDARPFEESFLPDLTSATPPDSDAIAAPIAERTDSDGTSRSEPITQSLAETLIDDEGEWVDVDADVDTYIESELAEHERVPDDTAGDSGTPGSAGPVQTSLPTPPFLQAVEAAEVDDPSDLEVVYFDDELDIESSYDASPALHALSTAADDVHDERVAPNAGHDDEFSFEEEETFAFAPVAHAQLAGDAPVADGIETDDPTHEVDVVAAAGDEIETAASSASLPSVSESGVNAPGDADPSGDLPTAASVAAHDDFFPAWEVDLEEVSASAPTDVVAAALVNHQERQELAHADSAAIAADAEDDVRAGGDHAERASESEDEPMSLSEGVWVEDVASAAVASERNADLTVTAIEGLVSHDMIDALATDESQEAVRSDTADVEDEGESATMDGGVAADDRPVFVTETMAELYLQQGFHDEALAIYRQLLTQHPDDPALHDRVAALERGATSAVVEGIVPRDVVDHEGQSVRQFFAHFARQAPRRQSDASSPAGHADTAADGRNGELEGRTAGAANRDEALTVPDASNVQSRAATQGGAASLTQLFASGMVSGADERAASTLASAYGAPETPPASRTAERELSLEHLFRDTATRSPGAVTLDEYYQGASPGGMSPASSSAEDGEERGADIEQFTAWLEGLKKK